MKELKENNKMTIPKQLLEAKVCNKNSYELKARIDKAIEYLEKRTARYHFTVFEFDELLDILKGSDKDE